MNNEATLDIVEDAEVLFRFLDGEYVCKKISPLNREIYCASVIPMKPAGYVLSVRTLLSTLIRRC